MTSKLACIVTLLVVCVAARAHADNGVVVIGGAAPEHDRTTVRTAIEATAREAGWTLQSKPLVKKDADALLNCRDATSPWTCVPASLSEGGVERVFVVAVDNKQGDNGVISRCVLDTRCSRCGRSRRVRRSTSMRCRSPSPMACSTLTRGSTC